MPIWPRKPALWLLHHGDVRRPDFRLSDVQEINSQRIALLPERVRRCVLGEYFQ